MDYQTDVVIVGAGATGATIARELSKYKIDVIVVEKSNDVGGISSKCNSAIVSGGADFAEGLKAKLQISSNYMFDRLSKELDVETKTIGSLTVAMNEEEIPRLEQYRREAYRCGVYYAEPISGDRARQIAPMLSQDAVAAVWVPNDKIVDVFEWVLANLQNAIANGVKVMMGTPVIGIDVDEDYHIQTVRTTKGSIKTKYVINAAGVYADRIAQMAGVCDYRSYSRTGLFYVLDKNISYTPTCQICPLPTPISRGVLLMPTVHGNTLVGPDAVARKDRADTSNSKESMEYVLEHAKKLVPALDPRDSITQFTGIRPARMPSPWKMEASEAVKGYVEAVGITGAIGAGPAIAVHMCEILRQDGVVLEPKENYDPYRVSIKRFRYMSKKERDEIIKQNPQYGNVICRCETITEGEIREAIRREPGACTVDGIKRRVRAGMGRCQGGFCSPRVVEILADELGVDPLTICKNEVGSEMLYSINRK